LLHDRVVSISVLTHHHVVSVGAVWPRPSTYVPLAVHGGKLLLHDVVAYAAGRDVVGCAGCAGLGAAGWTTGAGAPPELANPPGLFPPAVGPQETAARSPPPLRINRPRVVDWNRSPPGAPTSSSLTQSPTVVGPSLATMEEKSVFN